LDTPDDLLILGRRSLNSLPVEFLQIFALIGGCQQVDRITIRGIPLEDRCIETSVLSSESFPRLLEMGFAMCYRIPSLGNFSFGGLKAGLDKCVALQNF